MSSEADSFGRDRSRRRRDSSSSTTTTSRSRLCSRPDHARSTHRHASSGSRQARSSFSHEKRKYHDERSGKAVQYERESDYDDRSSRLKRVEVRLKRVDVDNPVDRDDRGARDEGLGSRVEVGVSIEKTLRKKPFTCPMCERGFTALSSVQDHINTCNSR